MKYIVKEISQKGLFKETLREARYLTVLQIKTNSLILWFEILLLLSIKSVHIEAQIVPEESYSTPKYKPSTSFMLLSKIPLFLFNEKIWKLKSEVF